jgi:hypothetical protein
MSKTGAGPAPAEGAAASRPRAVVYGLTQRGFFSEVYVLACHYAFALAAGEAFFVDDAGFVAPWPQLFEQPPPLLAGMDRGAYAEVIDCHPKRSRELWLERLRRVVGSCREGARVEVPALDFAGTWTELVIGLCRRLYRPVPGIVRQAAAWRAELGLDDQPFCAVHLRRGDKTREIVKANGARWSEGEAIGFAAYAEALAALAPGVRRVLMLTDDHREVDLARARHPELDIVSLCRSEDEGYHQSAFRALPREARIDAVRRLMAEVLIAARAEAFAGVYSSNVSLMVAALHPRPERCVSVDSERIWPPLV